MNKARLRYLILAMRPATLLVGLSPVFLGSFLGMKSVLDRGKELNVSHGLLVALAILLVILMQSAANLVNDVKDHEKGADGDDRVGPTRVVSSGLLTKDTVVFTYRLLFALALLISVGLAFYGGWQTIVLGLLCCVFAFLYTGGPFPLAYIGLGELVAFIFFGPIAVGGSAFLQTLIWDPFAIIVGFAPGFLAAAVMGVNNYRDRQSDLAVGKKTLATRLRPDLAMAMPWGFVLAALAFLFAPYLNTHVPATPYKVLAVFVALYVISFFLIKRPLFTRQGEELNVVLKRIALFELVYTLTLVGLIAA